MSNRLSNVSKWVFKCLIAATLFAMAIPAARADVGPPVKIRMPRATAMPAAAGREYAGTIEIEVGRAGLVDDFGVSGEGWQELFIDPNGPHLLAAGEILTVRFRALPVDAAKLMRFSLTFDGRRVVKSFDLSPGRFAQGDKPYALQRLTAPPQNENGPPAPEDGDGGPQGGGVTLHITARLVYTRAGSDANTDGDFDDTDDIPPVVLGADGVFFEIRDEDSPDFDETMFSGVTDTDGNVDVTFVWDDCDIFGCDDPDIYIRFETATDVVDVEESGVFENNYSWSNEDEAVEDFTGTELDLGTFTPADAAQFPALHIHTSIVRTHRFILMNDGTDVVHVDAQWPEDSNGAWYDGSELHIGTGEQWVEGTITHEYGHHFLENYSQNTDPDYCNCSCDNGCDGGPCDDCDSCSHCVWCSETDHDAWNEGWPNWLGSAVNRSYLASYGYDPFSIDDGRYTLEDLVPCDGGLDDPLTTEGFAGALCRDIEDDTQDDHDGDGIADCERDSLALGVDEIFQVVRLDQPTTPILFINAFRARFPEHDNGFWRTARNVGGDPYVWPDTEPPGVVTALDSPSHPLGGSGTSPYITVTWQHAPDDASGATAYSIVWSDQPAVEPDDVEEIDDPDIASATSPPFGLGQYYFSLRARDCVGNWSTDWAYFGPFVVTECNGNGIVDICETNCDAILGFCNVSGCGAASDCNLNDVPDECDIGSGVSDDCNVNGVPDECEATNFIGWVAADGFWHDQDNWANGVLPGPGDHACIDVPGTVTVTHSQGSTDIESFGCYENLIFSGYTLTTAADSAVYGSFTWTGGTLTVPAGTPPDTVHTLAHGGMNLSGYLTLTGCTLDNLGAAVLSGGSALYTSNEAVLNNPTDSTFDITGDGDIVWAYGNLGDIHNGGTFTKSGTGDSYIHPRFDNSGILDAQAGETHFYYGGLNVTDGGVVQVAAGATLNLSYAYDEHHFHPGSAISGSGDVAFQYDALIEGEWELAGITSILSGIVNFTSSDGTASIANYVQSNGTLTGADDVVAINPLTWSGGAMTVPTGTPPDTVHTIASAGMNLSGYLTLAGRTLDNLGAAVLSGGSALYTSNEAVLNNPTDSTFDITGDGDIVWAYGNLGDIHNGGTFTKSGTGDSYIHPRFDNSGILDVQAGETHFYYGGLNVTDGGVVQVAAGATLNLSFAYDEHHFHPGSAISGSGDVAFTHDALIEGDYQAAGVTSIVSGIVDFTSSDGTATIANYVQSAGALSGTDDVIAVSPLTWSGGTMTVPAGTPPDTVRTVAESGMNLSGSPSLTGRTLDNLGAATLAGAAVLYLGSEAVLNNPDASTFDILTDGDIGWSAGNNGQINNAGAFIKSGGAGDTYIYPIFNNAGALHVQSGTVYFYYGGLTQTAGVTLLDGGDIQSQPPVNIHGGELSGNGTVTGDVNTANTGAISPGQSAGVIEIVGDYTQTATGEMEIELGGYAQGDEFDLLTVSATAALDGTLHVSLIDGFTPQIGDQFVVLTAGTRTGAFPAITTTPSTLHVEVIYDAQSVILAIVDESEILCATCPGDANGDNSIDGDDVGPFVGCLLGGATACDCADMDGDADVDSDDVTEFAAKLLDDANVACP